MIIVNGYFTIIDEIIVNGYFTIIDEIIVNGYFTIIDVDNCKWLFHNNR